MSIAQHPRLVLGGGTSRPGAPTALVAALRPLAGRTRVRWLLDAVGRGAIGGLAGACVLALGGRLLAQPRWTEVAALWFAMAILGALIAALARRPDLWTVARQADRLGLGEQVSSALHAEAVGAPVAPLLLRDAASAIARLGSADFPSPWPRHLWRPLASGVLGLVLAALLPLPLPGDLQARQQRAEAVAASRRSVEALRAELLASLPADPVADRAVEELAALAAELARTESPAAANEAMELAQERLASLTDAESHAWRRSLDELAATWSERPATDALAQALRSRDPQAIDRAVEQIASRAGELTPEQQQALALALQSGANDARDVPGLARALREAATSMASSEATASDQAAALQELSRTLGEGADRAAALSTTQRAVAGLGQARATLSQTTAQTGTGNPGGSTMQTSSAAGSVTAAGGQSGSGSGQSGASSSAGNNPSGAGGATGSGSAGQAGNGGGTHAGSGGGTQSGTGAGGATGAGQGAGASGLGDGSAAQSGGGAGGGPTAGRPGGPNAVGTTVGGNRAPSNTAPTTYDPVSVPSLLGGSDGPQVAVSGNVSSASGESMDLPTGPVSLGTVRPYDSVYGEYEAAARQSVARQSLPSGLQGLVQRYFSSIAPEETSGQGTSAP